METIQKKIAALEEKKQKIKDEERSIKAKEKRAIARNAKDLGILAIRAGLSTDFDKEILLGAFLEISKKLKDDEIRMKWKNEWTKQNSKISDRNPLILTFDSPPNKAVKEIIKSYKFKWNDFRGEYHGHGQKEQLLEVFKGIECTIEIGRKKRVGQ